MDKHTVMILQHVSSGMLADFVADGVLTDEQRQKIIDCVQRDGNDDIAVTFEDRLGPVTKEELSKALHDIDIPEMKAQAENYELRKQRRPDRDQRREWMRETRKTTFKNINSRGRW